MKLSTLLGLLPLFLSVVSAGPIYEDLHAPLYRRHLSLHARQNNAADARATQQRQAQQAAARQAQQQQQAQIDAQRAQTQRQAQQQQQQAAQRNRQADVANGNNRGNGNNNGANANNGNAGANNGQNQGNATQTANANNPTQTANNQNNAGNNNNNNAGNNAGNNGGNNNNNGGGNNGAGAAADPNLTLTPDLIETNLAQDGQAVPIAGQIPSLTTTNNFINFCAGKTITNGQQITTGSCDPIPMGDIVAKDKMPHCKFVFPKNFQTIPANQDFTIQMALNNLQAGVFTNAQKTYYAAPQQVNGQGILIGHTHYVIQRMNNFDDPTILDPATFQFFKGINTPQVNGITSTVVTGGVPAGNYRIASINTSANHAPAIPAVAQRGFLDDISYFTAA